MPALRSTRTDKRTPRKIGARSTRSAVESAEESDLLPTQEAGPEDELDEEDDEEVDEEEAETRCICGQADPPDADGLFIQCEKCSVWQHGFCVSISVTVPEKYWCEQCRPELHSISIKNGEKKSKYLPVQPKESTRKANKRTASAASNNSNTGKSSNTPTEDELESSSLSKRNRRERATQDARYEAMIQRVMEESKKDANQTDVKSEDEKEKSSGRSSRNKRRKHDDADDTGVDDTKESIDADESMIDANTSKTTASYRSAKLKKDSPEIDQSASESQSTTSKAKKQKRTKTMNRPVQKEKDSKIDFNKPTKPRLPQQRTTLNEMRRRVAAILEFIGRTQVDIASEQSEKDELTKYVDDDLSKKRIEGLFENYTGSLQEMDTLTRKLLLWEQKFGKYGDK